MTAAKTTGITDEQLARLRDGGWMDFDDPQDDVPVPNWARWVGGAEVGDADEAQQVWWENSSWYAASGNTSREVHPRECDTLDAALDRCDDWRGDQEPAPASGACTDQADKFPSAQTA